MPRCLPRIPCRCIPVRRFESQLLRFLVFVLAFACLLLRLLDSCAACAFSTPLFGSRNRDQLQESYRSVACYGDSHTEGFLGGAWVPDLEKRLGARCTNYGVNSQGVQAISRRVRNSPTTDAAVVLAGTNDVLLDLSAAAGNDVMLTSLRARNNLPTDYMPSITSFTEGFRELLQLVPAKRIFVLSLPPLGEASEGEAADAVAAYNVRIREQVKACPGAVYVPLHESLVTWLPDGEGEAFLAAENFQRSVGEMIVNTGLVTVPFAGATYDSLAKRRGRVVLHDLIHLTESSAAVITDLLVDKMKAVCSTGSVEAEKETIA